MRTTEENEKLAQLLFPDVKESREDLFKKYPKRNLKDGAMVLRFAPSPTGFMHIGNVYSGLISTLLAKQSGGISILRIEDTDKTREIENGISLIVNGLRTFGIQFDEGPEDEEKAKGEYGPYIQSQRLDIYKVFAKDMVSNGNAYPCFITEEELENIRTKQTDLGVRTGYYGQWAKWRDASFDEVKERLSAGESFAIRMYSTGDSEKSFNTNDIVKGNVTFRENDMDVVLLKSDGYPTYHFAHPIDDTLMGITQVTRADEWFASVPLHIELFSKLGFKQLPYGHWSPLMKLDGKSRRKLSKRKDPEAAAQFYIEHGYPKEGILEYFLNIANSNFYDWKMQNTGKSIFEFKIRLDKFNRAGALFDIVKLNDMCKEYISTLTAEGVYDMSLEWAKSFNEEIYELLKNNKDYCINIFNIERTGEKIRKDLVKFEDVVDQLTIFFDELLENEKAEDISERIGKDIQKKVIERYLRDFTIQDTQEEWFENVKKVSGELGIEKVGDVAMVLRLAITHRTRTPDLYQVIKVLGEDKVKERLQKYIDMVI